MTRVDRQCRRQYRRKRQAALRAVITSGLAGALLGTALPALAASPALAGSVETVNDAPLHYIGSLSLRPSEGELAAGWTIVISDPALDRISFALRSTLGMAQVSGPDVQTMTTEDDPRYGGAVRLYHIDLVPADLDGDRIVKFAYDGPLFDSARPLLINTIDPHKIELTVDSFWFPFDARFDTDLTAQLFVRAPGDWMPVGVDQVDVRKEGYVFKQTRPALDIAFSLLANPNVVQKPGYTVYDARTEIGAKLPELGDALRFCTAYLNDLAGAAGPLPEASVVVTDRADGAYSRGTLIALTDIENEDSEALHQFICHELAHYWSHANAGGPENWINEGVADYLANMGVREALGEAVFLARMARYRDGLADFGIQGRPDPIWTVAVTDRPDYWVMYRAAPVALQDLENRMGRAVFRTLMQTMMAEKTATTSGLLDLVERLDGTETRDWFEARLAR